MFKTVNTAKNFLIKLKKLQQMHLKLFQEKKNSKKKQQQVVI